MHTILIVGNSFSGLTSYLKSRGYNYVVLKDKSKAKNLSKNLKNRILCDFSSIDAIKQAIDEAVKKYSIDAVMTVYENYVVSAAMIADYLNLPGLPISAAEACTDKYLMRGLFAKSPQKISPDYDEINSLDDALAFAADHAYPLILKPANLAKSLLVTKNNNQDELIHNYNKMQASIAGIYKKYAPLRSPKIIIEEFMTGPIHSVDAFVDQEGTPHVLEQVVDYQTGYDIGFDDNFHYSRLLPSKLSSADINAIRQTAAAGCRALGMKSSPAHIEIIRTSQGPRIVEIGARNGGYRERMHGIANDIDIPGNAILVALGQKPSIKANRNEPCAVLELFPKKPGTFTGINHAEELQQLPSLQYYALKQPLGHYVGSSSDGYKMCAIIMLHHTDTAQFASDLAYVNDHVYAMTDTN